MDLCDCIHESTVPGAEAQKEIRTCLLVIRYTHLLQATFELCAHVVCACRCIHAHAVEYLQQHSTSLERCFHGLLRIKQSKPCPWLRRMYQILLLPHSSAASTQLPCTGTLYLRVHCTPKRNRLPVQTAPAARHCNPQESCKCATLPAHGTQIGCSTLGG